jgi:WD40 repeat protein
MQTSLKLEIMGAILLVTDLVVYATTEYPWPSFPHNRDVEREIPVGAHREIAGLSGHAEIVRSAAFSPDGQRLIASSADSTAKLWDVLEG